MRFTVILEPEEEDGLHARCLALKGRQSQGETKKKALANIQEGIAASLESLRDDEGLPFPRDVVTQQVEAAA